ncbi:splicing factor 45-like [Dreissena polymorpha]|uniref:splicing factor 45-like n=1 Tax=Dreissena polymorpha TaxID=45954 RepID=UPI00226433C2|nr:splicing factor 45-like [Dreissena polymorpha]
MSLYDDLDVGKEEKADVAAGWSSSYKLMKSQLQAKKASLIQTKSSRKSHLAPVADFKKGLDQSEGSLKFNMLTGKLENVPVQEYRRERERDMMPSLGGSPFIASDPMPSLTGVKDEYNPLRPNDYEEMMKKRKEQKSKEREEDERRRDREPPTPRDDRRRREPKTERDSMGEMERGARRQREEDEEEEYERPVRRKPEQMGAAIAPPMSLLEEPPIKKEDDGSLAGITSAGGLSVAAKIMSKYGYKEGQGLGKSEQGMSTALFVEKTSKRGGKIIHERDLPKDTPREAVTNANLLRNPTKVILLRNMVGPGEVDGDLEGETFEECGKYGKVIKCLIFEMPDSPDDECVRIFVEFDRIDSAIKAIIDLNGRYFGGRVVKACFYNLDKFRRLDLATDVDMLT